MSLAAGVVVPCAESCVLSAAALERVHSQEPGCTCPSSLVIDCVTTQTESPVCHISSLTQMLCFHCRLSKRNKQESLLRAELLKSTGHQPGF